MFLRQSPHFDIHACPSLTDRTAVITGGSDGIGGEIVKHLLLHDISQVIVLARNPTKYNRTLATIWQPALTTAGTPERIDRVRFLPCDASDIAAVDRAAKEILKILPRLDFLFLNAGRAFELDYYLCAGTEVTFATNHLGHFHLTQVLTPLLVTSAPSRVIVTSSIVHRIVRRKFSFADLESPTPTTAHGKAWDSLYRYARSKLANVLFTRALARRLPVGVVPNSFDPGSVPTDAVSVGWQNLIGKWCGLAMAALLRMTGQTAEEAATTALYVAVGEAEKVGRGCYFAPVAKKERTSALAEDDEWAEELWEWSEKMVERALAGAAGGGANVPSELLAHPVCLPPA